MSKRNRDRHLADNLGLSTRPEEAIIVPDDGPLEARPQPATESAGEPVLVQTVPTYPCPVCGPFGGIGDAQSSRETIVYLKCRRCRHTWSANRVRESRPVWCKTVPKPST